MLEIPNPLSSTSLNTPTDGKTPTQLQVLEEQLAASKAKHNAKVTKATNKGSGLKTDKDTENSKPKKKWADGSGLKAVKPEHGKEEKEAVQ